MLNATQIKVLKLIHEGGWGPQGELGTRIAERSVGDVEFLQHGVPRGFALTESEFLNLLHQLEFDGYLESSETEHTFDGSEYVVRWKITPKGEQALSG